MTLRSVISRLAFDEMTRAIAYRIAEEFPTREALNKYLKEHPGADKSRHWVTQDTEGPGKADKSLRTTIHRVHEESIKTYESEENMVNEQTTGVEEHTNPIFSAVPDFPLALRKQLTPPPAPPKDPKPKVKEEDIQEGRSPKAPKKPSEPPEITAARKVEAKKVKEQVKGLIKGKPFVQNIAKRYGLEEKDVESTVIDFFATGGGTDTKVDLNNKLREKAKQVVRTRIIAESRQVGVIPEAILKFIPANLGFSIDNQHHTKLVEHFGNKEKTMMVKVKESQLVLHHKNAIMDKVSKDLDSPNEKTRMTALIVRMGIHTGFRPGSRGTVVEHTDKETGETVREKTYGATTLKKEHIQAVKNGVVSIAFKGKKGTLNTADIDDAELAKHLEAFTEGKDSGDYIFEIKGQTDKKGKPLQVTDEDVNDYVRDYGITFTDFRKMRATKEVFEKLKADSESLYTDIANAQSKNREDTMKKVTEAIMTHLDKIYKEAQTTLSHDDVQTTINAYVNPMVVMNFISSGKLSDKLDEAIEDNDTISFNLDAIVKEAQKYAKKAV